MAATQDALANLWHTIGLVTMFAIYVPLTAGVLWMAVQRFRRERDH